MDQNTAIEVNTGAWHAILSASPIVQLTLITLLIMSVISWAIIYFKFRQFKVLERSNAPFQKDFFAATSLDDVYKWLDRFPHSPMARVFKAGYLELQKIADSNLVDKSGGEGSVYLLSGIDNLERALRKEIDSEIALMERRLPFLATTGSTGPFIGLFGTVLGIMGSFQKIAATNMASLAVVAPGISEALVATAVGLGAAIPATVGYNHYLSELRKQEVLLNNFAADFLNIAKRNFFKDE